MNKYGHCVDCGKYAITSGRGLCKNYCYSKHRNRGTLENFPRTTWKNAELMKELGLCQRRGLTVPQAAEVIGVTLPALRRAIYRARERACRDASSAGM